MKVTCLLLNMSDYWLTEFFWATISGNMLLRIVATKTSSLSTVRVHPLQRRFWPIIAVAVVGCSSCSIVALALLPLHC